MITRLSTIFHIVFRQRLGLGPVIVIFAVSLCTACGAVGSPIPPEDVGIEAKIRKQRQQAAQDVPASEEEVAEQIPIEEEPVQLPPLHPIGTR